MFNLARQAYANPFLSAVGAFNQPGLVSSVGRCPTCGNAVTIEGTIGTIQPPNLGQNPLGVGTTIGQQMGGFAPIPFAYSQPGLGPINPLASQLTAGIAPMINPLPAQVGQSWPLSTHLAHQGLGGRIGAAGVDPRSAFGQQFGFTPNVAPGFINPNIAVDPISSLVSQQVNPLTQQQLPIRPLIGGQQGFGQQQVPGFASPITQWTDPYRAFIEAQLISQLATNPLYQLQQAYGGVPQVTGFGMPFAVGQQFNPLWGNVPFYG